MTGEKNDATWFQSGDFNATDEVKVKVKFGEKVFEILTEKVGDAYIGIKCPTFGYEFGAAVRDELKSQLDSCNQLLEFEPDSKWTLLTASLLMRSIDRFHYHAQTLDFLKKLQKVDSLRAGYYKDLASKWTVEVKLKNWIEKKEFHRGKVDLTNLELTTLYYQQYFAIATEVNLEGNPKFNKKSCKFSSIKGCEVKF